MKTANSSVNITDLQPRMLDFITELEKLFGKEVVITSGFRGPDHPIEAAKKSPGEHAEGLAIDIAVTTPADFYNIVSIAQELGCERIGISRKSNFIHLGLSESRPHPTIWTY